MSDLWANDNTEYNDDDVYKDHCLNLNMYQASVPLFESNLYVNRNAPATQAQGGTKTHYTPVPGGAMLLDTGDKSDCQFSIERLAWVDGWQESSTVEGKLVQKQPMTLIVLKFVLQTFDQDLRVETVKATLQLKDVDKHRGDDPEVQAWAPFHKLEDWNATKAQDTAATNMNATASGGYAGSSLSLGWGKNREVSWNRTAFDEGRSILFKSKRKQRPIGVTWSMKQNKLENLGVSPEVWAAVLFKRTTPNLPYLVKFRLDVRTGTRRDWTSKGQEFLRIKPGDTSSFTATPKPGVWDETNCSGEGENIRDSKNVDLDNLGKLLDSKDRTALRDTWAPQYKHSAPSVKEAEQGKPAALESAPTAAQIVIAVEPRETVPTHTVEPPTPKAANITTTAVAAAAAGLPPALSLTDTMLPLATPPAVRSDPEHGRPIPEPPVVDRAPKEEPPLSRQPSYHLPQVAVGASSIEGDASSSSRLVALEARAVHTEARLAAQDLLILQLQRAVDARDARLARMEQVMRVAATVLSQLQ